MNLTPIARQLMRRRAKRAVAGFANPVETQLRQLRWLLFKGVTTRYGEERDFDRILRETDPRRAYAEVIPTVEYEDIRPYVMRMFDGEKDVLWPGRCYDFAQSSGTSGGRSKFIPVTRDSLRLNHYEGAGDVVALYLRDFPESRMFSGKGFILGGSFESRLESKDPKVHVGDLSATLIDKIGRAANLFRVPDKRIALMSDWSRKLDLLAETSIKENITNLSGVPSWFMKVLERALEISGKSSLKEIWPSLEVFFHGGISFLPYREHYERLFGAEGELRYRETYNASEGFFAAAAGREGELTLLLHNAVYYEFIPLVGDMPVMIEDLQPGHTYELVITAPNGLFRYRLGDTVTVTGLDPLRIRLAGRTKAFINAFGEELMVENAEYAVAEAAKATGATPANFTAGPKYAGVQKRGCHRWLFEWVVPPADPAIFGEILDRNLRMVNSDYDAKRSGDIFLGAPEIISLPAGSFDRWLESHGNGKLGGQRKVPRLSNTPEILNQLLSDSDKQDNDEKN